MYFSFLIIFILLSTISNSTSKTFEVKVTAASKYVPEELSISVNDTVKFNFEPEAENHHSVTHGLFCSRSVLKLFDFNRTSEVQFLRSGSYPYFSDFGEDCTVKGMIGKIIVVSSDGSTSNQLHNLTDPIVLVNTPSSATRLSYSGMLVSITLLSLLLLLL